MNYYDIEDIEIHNPKCVIGFIVATYSGVIVYIIINSFR